MAGKECLALCGTEVLEPLSRSSLAVVLRCHDGLENILWECWGRKMWQGQSTWCMPCLSCFMPSGTDMCSTSQVSRVSGSGCP